MTIIGTSKWLRYWQVKWKVGGKISLVYERKWMLSLYQGVYPLSQVIRNHWIMLKEANVIIFAIQEIHFLGRVERYWPQNNRLGNCYIGPGGGEKMKARDIKKRKTDIISFPIAIEWFLFICFICLFCIVYNTRNGCKFGRIYGRKMEEIKQTKNKTLKIT